jgi:hypothetical protein
MSTERYSALLVKFVEARVRGGPTSAPDLYEPTLAKLTQAIAGDEAAQRWCDRVLSKAKV